MARYGSFKYGSGVKYGTSPTTSNLLWTFLVKWDGLFYDGFNEGRRLTDLTISRGRDYLVKPNGNGWEHYKPGMAVGIFDNSDGRYDPYNTSSPLYPNVTPGKFVIIRVKEGNTGGNFNTMRGTIADIQPINEGRRKKVMIKVVDGLQWLADREVRLGLRQNVSVSGTINAILDRAGFPKSEWSFSSVNTGETLRYHWSWIGNALDLIHELEEHDGGAFLHDRFGSMLFFAGNSTHLGTVTVNESELLADIAVPQPWETVRNVANINTYPKRFEAVNTTLWQLDDVPAISSGQSLAFDILFRYASYSVCGSGVQFNYTVNSQADGSGVNLTPNCTLTVYPDVGDGTTLTMTNHSGTNGYITLLRASGDVIYAPYRSVQSASDTDSQALYGARQFNLEGKWMQSTGYGQAYADWVVSQLKDPKKFPIVQLENRPTLQFGRDIYRDRITLNSPSLGINGEFFRIGKVEHRWLRENGQAVRTTWKLEPYLAAF